jgi:uncharacterized membrane protein
VVQGKGSMSTIMSQASYGRAGPLRFGRIVGAGSLQWLLKRNCSLAPRQLMAIYLSLCVLTFAIAALCWQVGATLVMPFAGVEVLLFGAALLVYARHAADSEQIRLRRGALTVRRTSGAHVEQVEFEPSWVRVEPQRGDRSLIELSGQGRRIAVGRFVAPELRPELADELRWALRRWPADWQPDAI